MNLRRWLFPLLLLALLAFATSAAAKTVYFTEQHYTSGVRQMPDYIGWSDDTWIEQVTWSSWGGPTASGSGVMDSEYVDPTAVSIAFSKRKRCGPWTIYSKGSFSGVSLVDGQPFTYPIKMSCRIFFVTGSNGYITDLQQLVSPKHFDLGELFIRHMHWTKWNSSVVRGHGDYREPVDGRTRRVRFRLSDPGYCYALAAIVYRKQRISFRRHGSWHSSTSSYRYACDNPPTY